MKRGMSTFILYTEYWNNFRVLKVFQEGLNEEILNDFINQIMESIITFFILQSHCFADAFVW